MHIFTGKVGHFILMIILDIMESVLCPPIFNIIFKDVLQED